MESETNSIYTKHAGKSFQKDGSYTIYYHCNRTGSYRPTVEDHMRKRKMKATGTGFCCHLRFVTSFEFA